MYYNPQGDQFLSYHPTKNSVGFDPATYHFPFPRADTLPLDHESVLHIYPEKNILKAAVVSNFYSISW
jgi:hypothetical protein